ncbi:Flagellar assembly protein FliH [Lachnospiraceae bacterium XBB1006]|nr:Flagellar assembly protein FliH [Lachnospiraceae bacterium XBB1006]
MRNLVKQRNIVNNSGESRVIDSNVKMEEILNKFNNPEGFSPGLFATEMSEDEHSEEADIEENPGLDALVTDYPEGESYEVLSEEVPEVPEETMESIMEQKETILAEAREQALAEAEEIKNRAYQEAIAEAEEDIARRRQAIDDEINNEKQMLQLAYERKIEELEPGMVDTFLDVFHKVLHVEISDYRDIMMAMIKDTLLETDNPKELAIQVGEETYDRVKESLPELKELLGEDVKLEILKNSQLGATECKIETDFGIYDCGFDEQLRNLSNRMRLLSQWTKKE